MNKYRGFEGEIIDRFNMDGLGATWATSRNGAAYRGGFVGPTTRVVAYTPPPVIRTPPRPPVVTYTPPQPPVATIMPVTPPYGVPGDIRDLLGRSQPGEVIDVDPAGAVDDMSAENGVPGVDDSGRFPYGDPRSAEKVPTKAGENTGLIIAAILAALVLGV